MNRVLSVVITLVTLLIVSGHSHTVAAGSLTLNVTNRFGNPAANAWASVYNAAGNQFGAGYTDGLGRISFTNVPDATNYIVIVSSSNDHFLLRFDGVTSPGVLNVNTNGATAVDLSAYQLDGTTPLQGGFGLGSQTLPRNLGGCVGWPDATGHLFALVTPGAYNAIVVDMFNRYELILPNQNITGQTSSIVLNAAAMPTGIIIDNFEGASSSTFNADSSLFSGCGLSINMSNGDRMVISSGGYSIYQFLNIFVNGTQWSYGIVHPTQTVLTGGTLSLHAGGTLSASLTSNATTYYPGQGGSVTPNFKDAYNNQFYTIASYNPWQEHPATIRITDSAGRVVFSQARSMFQAFPIWFSLPPDTALGTATATVTVDTGPYQGILTASTSFIVQSRDSIAPTTQATLNPLAKNGWNNSGVVISFTATDNPGGSGVKEIHSIIDGGPEMLVLGASGSRTLSSEGIHNINYFARDNAGNTEVAKSLIVKIDLTAPTVTCTSPSPTFLLNQQGAVVSASVADIPSGPAATLVIAPVNTSTLGTFAVTLEGFDLAGNRATQSCPYHVINTPAGNDVIVGLGTGDTVTFAGVSSVGTTLESVSSTFPTPPSGFTVAAPPTYYDITTTATYTPPLTVCLKYDPTQFSDQFSPRILHYENGAWADVTTSVDATNLRVCGQVTSLSPFVVAKKDTTSPSINITSPSNTAYLINAVVAADYSCADGGTGVASCVGTVANGANINTASAGTKSFTVNAMDKAGNASSKTVSYNVIYNFSGFFQPVDNLPALNQAKAGSAIPVKFGLAGNQGLAIFAPGYPVSQQIACDTNVVADIEQTVTAGNSSLWYDPATNQYNYVWKTDSAWAGTCRQLIVKLIDGTEHKANFKFK